MASVFNIYENDINNRFPGHDLSKTTNSTTITWTLRDAGNNFIQKYDGNNDAEVLRKLRINLGFPESILLISTTLQKDALSGVMEGQTIFDSDLDEAQTFNGTSWVTDGADTATWGGIDGTLGDQTDVQDEFDLKEDTANKGIANGYAPLDGSLKLPVAHLVYGTERSYSEDDSESTTALFTFVNKLQLVTPVLTAGNYMIRWSFDLSNTNTNKTVRAEVKVDSVQEGLCEPFITVANDNHCFSGFKQLTLTNATHTIDINFSAVSSGTAKIREARIEIYRVS